MRASPFARNPTINPGDRLTTMPSRCTPAVESRGLSCNTPAQFTTFLDVEIAKWGKVIQRAQIKPD